MTYPIPDDVLIHHAAFLGKTRSGKTSSAKTAVERFVAAGERVCILDPIKSDWWGLTSSPDGSAPGLPFYILGGPHGHVPLPSTSGKLIGELVARGELPLSIIDMADFEAGGLQRFFSAFAEALMKNQRGVLHLVIEEAHEFAPKERGGPGDENAAIHWAKKLATAGGSKGIRLIVATQRIQALHNAILGSCETLVAHRLTAPADQKPVVDWLKANVEKGLAAEITGSLSSLTTGSAWVCSGEARLFERVEFPRIATFDNSATPTGDEAASRVQTAQVDVEALRFLLAPVEVHPPAPTAKGASVDEIRAAENRGKQEGYQHGWSAGLEEGERRGFAQAMAAVRNAFEALVWGAGPQTAAEPPEPAPAPRQRRPTPVPAPRQPRPSAPASGALGLLQSAARVHPCRLTWGQIAQLAGRKPRGGHFNTSKKSALDQGWLREVGNMVEVTDAGLDAAGVERHSGPLADIWASALPGPADKMFSALRERPGMTLTGLASVLQMQPRGGHWNTGMSTLKRNSLIVEDDGRLFLAPELLEGSPA